LRINYYLKSHGVLSRKENTLYFIKKGDNGEIQKTPIPIEKVFAIFCYGRVTLSSGSIHFLSKYNIPVHFFNKYGYKVGTYYPRPQKVSGRVLLAQVSYHLDNLKRIALAKSFVKGGLSNILINMRYYKRTYNEVSQLEEKVQKHMNQIENTNTINELMGNEANARKEYYKMFDLILPSPFKFETRSMRPPKNMFNALLSFGNSLVYSTVLSEIYTTHLDPTISYLHELYDRRFSLSLDISEVFKPLLSDRVILHLLMKGELGPDGFDSNLNGVLLNDKDGTKFLQHYEMKLMTTIKHRSLGRNVSYRSLIRLECLNYETYSWNGSLQAIRDMVVRN
jgi:CRISP-associated protein Cas1